MGKIEIAICLKKKENKNQNNIKKNYRKTETVSYNNE